MASEPIVAKVVKDESTQFGQAGRFLAIVDRRKGSKDGSIRGD
jgi:hypothetical protein